MADDPLFDANERKQLADLFDELGPDPPSLLDPWTTHDLAAHLVLREHDYLAAPAPLGETDRLLRLSANGFRTRRAAQHRSAPPDFGAPAEVDYFSSR